MASVARYESCAGTQRGGGAVPRVLLCRGKEAAFEGGGKHAKPRFAAEAGVGAAVLIEQATLLRCGSGTLSFEALLEAREQRADRRTDGAVAVAEAAIVLGNGGIRRLRGPDAGGGQGRGLVPGGKAGFDGALGAGGAHEHRHRQYKYGA
ncbi:hypothetical protein GCM10023184_41990 [Flaviaesturariibacter amylovorans]|uniref:Uncharacterized protein n=1 Tax=Flaviaesturariibacter amylovorans TaxID=1084520 RepID=A0ABP8HQ01_9BACT